MKFRTLILLTILLQGCKPSQKTLWCQKDWAERKAKKMTYWYAGDIELGERYAREKVFKKIGLTYEMVWGCQINKTITKSIQRHNDWVTKQVGITNSEEILTEIYKQADSIYKIDSEILNYAQQDNKLTRTIINILDTTKRSAGIFSVENSDKKNIHILNYNEIDGYGNRQRLLLSIEIELPAYTFRVLSPKN